MRRGLLVDQAQTSPSVSFTLARQVGIVEQADTGPAIAGAARAAFLWLWGAAIQVRYPSDPNPCPDRFLGKFP